MRHGYRGAAEMAEAIANLLAFAATTNVVHSRQFDLVYDATLGDDVVSAFLQEANPAAAKALARTFEIARERGFWTTRRNFIGLALEQAEAVP
jgi:cobaltochelatase CobN